MAGSTRSRTPAQPEDPREQLRQEHRNAWIPVAEGDVIHGQVIDVDQAWSDVREKGSWYPILTITADEATGYTIDPDSGTVELKVHGFGAVIYNELMRRKPRVGETVRISYDGERPPRQPDHNPTKVYTVRVEGREDEGADVYASIAREQAPSTVGRHRRATAPPADVPAGAEDFNPPAREGGEEDIPF